jgi:YbgC/YbaW family acyl-CoA thioester hydrolase
MDVVEARVRVRYAETDQMGVVYHANYLVWMEVGRVEYWRAAGLRYRDMEQEDGVLLVVAEVNCRYRAPALYDEEVVISLGDVSAMDAVNLAVLVAGLVLGAVLLLRAVRPAHNELKTTLILLVCWVAVFGWYWFSRFGVTELHSLDPEKMALERVKQTATSIAFFLLWVGLFSIGPVLRARQIGVKDLNSRI